MKRGTFKKPSLEKIQEINERKRQKALQKAKKRTSSKPKKRVRKAKQPSVRQLKDKLWAECKRITRERHGNICYTCGKQPLEGSDWHTGHSKPKAALPLLYKFDIRGLRPQCARCNLNLGGATDIFIAKLEQEEEGMQFLNEACYLDVDSNAWRIRQDVAQLGGKDATIFIENLLEQYKQSYL